MTIHEFQEQCNNPSFDKITEAKFIISDLPIMMKQIINVRKSLYIKVKNKYEKYKYN